MKGYEDLVKLLKTTQATGMLDVTEQAICEYQDMIGHSTIEQNRELSNSEFKESFYRVYGYSYGTYEALRFFWANSDHVQELRDRLDCAEEDAEDAKNDLEKQKAETDKYIELFAKADHAWRNEQEHVQALEKQIEEQEQEITRLKARLYDLMTK